MIKLEILDISEISPFEMFRIGRNGSLEFLVVKSTNQIEISFYPLERRILQ